jgi:NAD(P)H-hydrate epimerase
MDGYGGDQIRAAERPHLDAGEPLMQRAADGLARIVGDMLDDPAVRPTTDGDPGGVLLLVGSGDNGGDALFAGARLAAAGRRVEVVRTSGRVHESGLRACLEAGASLQAAPAGADTAGSGTTAGPVGSGTVPETAETDADALAAAAREAALRTDIVLDGVLGIGTTGSTALRSPAREVVQAIRELARDQLAPFVVAVDVPSGVDADSGAVADDHVLHADVTVTFGGVKAGLLRGPGASLAGRIELVDVGIGTDLATVEPLVRT